MPNSLCCVKSSTRKVELNGCLENWELGDGSGEGEYERIRYLDKTKSSGSIIRVVIDELGEESSGGLGSSNGGGPGDKRDYDLIGVNASREYILGKLD